MRGLWWTDGVAVGQGGAAGILRALPRASSVRWCSPEPKAAVRCFRKRYLCILYLATKRYGGVAGRCARGPESRFQITVCLSCHSKLIWLVFIYLFSKSKTFGLNGFVTLCVLNSTLYMCVPVTNPNNKAVRSILFWRQELHMYRIHLHNVPSFSS